MRPAGNSKGHFSKLNQSGTVFKCMAFPLDN
jgi:hypothetical protein